ncbi:hypothetical protein [Streptomyces sp. NPDC004528]|uniref:hypothetical protein n=1 Tax=Streptomyces sp. NPDC004528 TaxID=3154550 RepID=UPI0033B71215
MARGSIDDIFDDEETQAKPRHTRSGRRNGDALDDDEPKRGRHEKSRRGRDTFEDDEDDEVAPRKGKHQRGNSARKNTASAGWDAFDDVAGSGGSYEEKNELKLEITKDPQLVKALEPAPFDSFELHWVKEITNGKRSFRGLAPGDDCPLCDDLDHYGRKVAYFNVALWDEDEAKWVNKVWEVGIRVARTLQAIAKDPKKVGRDEETANLASPQLYLSVHKTGKGTKTEYHVEAVKARDVEPDWDAGELTAADHDRLAEGLYSDPWERHCTRAELEAVVKKVLDDGYDDEDDD